MHSRTEMKNETKSLPARTVGLNPRTGVFSPSRGESRKANLSSRKLPSTHSDRRTLLRHTAYTHVYHAILINTTRPPRNESHGDGRAKFGERAKNESYGHTLEHAAALCARGCWRQCHIHETFEREGRVTSDVKRDLKYLYGDVSSHWQKQPFETKTCRCFEGNSVTSLKTVNSSRTLHRENPKLSPSWEPNEIRDCPNDHP